MEETIPKIYFDLTSSLDIEVMSFRELSEKLLHAQNHDPFSVHRIEFFLILIVTQHSYSHFVDFKSYSLSKGSALFVAKNQVHHFTQDLASAEGICIVFRSLFTDNSHFISHNLNLNRLFNYHIEEPVIHQSELGQDTFIDIAYKLYEEYSFPNNFAKSEMLRTLLYLVLLKAERAKDMQSISGVSPQWLEIFRRFKDLLEKEYVESRNSRHYASELFISYKHLNDIVKKITGKTVKAFIDEFVTTEIKRYLVSTNLSVKEISYTTGFEEPANMVKFFKKHTHTTPHKFRQQL